MTALSASSVTALPFARPVRNHGLFNGQVKQKCGCPVGCFIPPRGHNKLDGSSPICLALQSQPVDRRGPITYSSRKLFASVTCAAALTARASASGQTQTLTREAPTITKAPVRGNNFSRQNSA
uniref:Uncharacterized protein LOC105134874 n=1 Tax=Rhizophora mucronata TaxID=61149 RepID=A0A2P2LVP1_RHIMU